MGGNVYRVRENHQTASTTSYTLQIDNRYILADESRGYVLDRFKAEVIAALDGMANEALFEGGE